MPHHQEPPPSPLPQEKKKNFCVTYSMLSGISTDTKTCSCFIVCFFFRTRKCLICMCVHAQNSFSVGSLLFCFVHI